MTRAGLVAAILALAVGHALAGDPAADEQVAAADALEARGDRAGALAAVESALRADGRHVEALRRRGAWRAEVGLLEGALGDLDRAVERAPDAGLLALRAAVQLELGERGEAEEGLTRALALDPDHPDALATRAWAAITANRLEAPRLAEDLRRATRPGLPPARLVPALLARAELARRRGRIDDAARDLVAAAGALHDRRALPARERLAALLPDAASIEARADALEAAARQPGSHPVRAEAEGLGLLDGGEEEQGLELLRRAVEADPARADAAVALARHVDPEEASELLDRAAKAAAGPARARALVARALLEGWSDDPLADLDAAVVADPMNLDARLHRATRRAGRDDPQVEADLDVVLARRPGDADAWQARAQARLDRGRVADGLADLDRALELAPRRAGPWRARARARLTLLGDYAGAARDAERVVHLEPDGAEDWVALADARRRADDAAGAREAIERALARAPGMNQAWVLRGKLRADAGDGAGAHADAREVASRMGGDEKWSRLARAPILEALDDVDGVAEDYRGAIAHGADDGWVAVALAFVELARGRRDAALTALERHGPEEPYAVLIRAAAGASKDGLEAVAAAGKWPAPIAAHLLGRTTAEALLAAAEEHGQGFGLPLQRCEARTYLGLVAEREGRPDEARRHFEAAVASRADEVFELAYARRRLAALRRR